MTKQEVEARLLEILNGDAPLSTVCFREISEALKALPSAEDTHDLTRHLYSILIRRGLFVYLGDVIVGGETPAHTTALTHAKLGEALGSLCPSLEDVAVGLRRCDVDIPMESTQPDRGWLTLAYARRQDIHKASMEYQR